MAPRPLGHVPVNACKSTAEKVYASGKHEHTQYDPLSVDHVCVHVCTYHLKTYSLKARLTQRRAREQARFPYFSNLAE